MPPWKMSGHGIPPGMTPVFRRVLTIEQLMLASTKGTGITLNINKPNDTLQNIWTGVFPGFDPNDRGWTDANNTDRIDADVNIVGRFYASLQFGPTKQLATSTTCALNVRVQNGVTTLETHQSNEFIVTGNDQFHDIEIDFSYNGANWNRCEINCFRNSGDTQYALQGCVGNIYIIAEPA